MQTHSIWLYRDGLLVKNFPDTPYIDTVYRTWCGDLYHIKKDFNREWTSNPNLYPHISEYGYDVLAEETPSVQWQSTQRQYFGDNNLQGMVDYFNEHRNDPTPQEY